MHEKFADWFRVTTSSALQPDLLERRWNGVEATVERLVPGEEFDLVRLLLQLPPGDDTFPQKLRGNFKAADPTFAMQGNDLEISVLAGTALVRLFDEGSEAAGDRAALALGCACGLSMRKELTWVPEFLREANKHCNSRSRDLRKPVEVMLPSFNRGSVEAAAENFPGGDWARFSNSVKNAFGVLLKDLHAFTEGVETAVKALAREQALRKEETDILWWMTAGYSRDLDRPYSEVGQSGAALITGKELADLVTAPGPLPAKSFLDKVLSTTGAKSYRKAVQLGAAVVATPLDWRRRVSESPGLGEILDLCPVLGAISGSLTTEGNGEWYPAYKKAYRLDPKLNSFLHHAT